jgi:uncharacterized membrane protein
MVTLEASVDIDRPVEEVFEYVADLSHIPDWAPSMQNVQVDGPVRVGAKVRQTHVFLGKSVDVTSEITEYQVNRSLGFTSPKPFRVTQTTEFEPRDGGTRVTGRLQAEFGLLGSAAERVFLKKAEKEHQDDYTRLKRILESAARAQTPAGGGR